MFGGTITSSVTFVATANAQFRFNSNSIPNMSPALRELFLIVLGTQMFKTMNCSPRINYKTQTQELDFKVSAR